MAGCRSLTDSEVNQVLSHLGNERDKCLFILGLRTGYRISELLSLNVSDVFIDGQVTDRIKVQRRNIKGKNKSREVALHPQAREAIKAHIAAMSKMGINTLSEVAVLFGYGVNKRLSRHGAHKLLKQAYNRAGVGGPKGSVAWHSARKTFAAKVYTNLKFDLLATRDALGHSDVRDTQKYIQVNQASVDAAILSA